MGGYQRNFKKYYIMRKVILILMLTVTAMMVNAQITFTTNKTNINGCGGSYGSINVTNVSGGSPTYTYSKNGGSTFQGSNLFNNLTAGLYQIAVKDANGVISSNVGATIGTNATVGLTTTIYDATDCAINNGAISVLGNGGCGVYNYSKDGGVTYQSSNIFSHLMAGTYNIMVKDAQKCLSPITPTTVNCPQ